MVFLISVVFSSFACNYYMFCFFNICIHLNYNSISAGVCVCIIVKRGSNGLISGIMAIVAGAALIVEALKDFAFF